MSDISIVLPCTMISFRVWASIYIYWIRIRFRFSETNCKYLECPQCHKDITYTFNNSSVVFCLCTFTPARWCIFVHWFSRFNSKRWSI